MEDDDGFDGRLAYIFRVEEEAKGFFRKIENPQIKESEEDCELIDGFIKNVDPEKIDSVDATNEEINKLWQNLREKMLDEKSQKNIVTTKRYVRQFIKDIKPKTEKTKNKEISFKIKLSKEEEDKLKLFGQL